MNNAMARPVVMEPSEFDGVRLAKTLITAVDADWTSRGETKRAWYERALRRELGLEHATSSNLAASTDADLFEPDQNLTLPDMPQPEQHEPLRLDMEYYTNGPTKVTGVSLGDSVRAAYQKALDERRYSKKRELFECALLRELGLLPEKSAQEPAPPVLFGPTTQEGRHLEKLSA